MFIADQLFELRTQPSTIVLGIANIGAIILLKQDDDDTKLEISENDGEDAWEFTFSSDIQEHDLDNQQEVLHLH